MTAAPNWLITETLAAVTAAAAHDNVRASAACKRIASLGHPGVYAAMCTWAHMVRLADPDAADPDADTATHAGWAAAFIATFPPEPDLPAVDASQPARLALYLAAAKRGQVWLGKMTARLLYAAAATQRGEQQQRQAAADWN